MPEFTTVAYKQQTIYIKKVVCVCMWQPSKTHGACITFQMLVIYLLIPFSQWEKELTMYSEVPQRVRTWLSRPISLAESKHIITHSIQNTEQREKWAVSEWVMSDEIKEDSKIQARTQTKVRQRYMAIFAKQHVLGLEVSVTDRQTYSQKTGIHKASWLTGARYSWFNNHKHISYVRKQ